MMPAETMLDPGQSFAPLPLRARGVLELLDVAIKAFKQYFWVLIAWTAIVNIVGAIGAAVLMLIPFGSWIAGCLTPPLIIGTASCCIAGAVRGQKVEFGQCWQFTRPRYWAMVGMYLMSFLVAGLATLGASVVFGLLIWGGILALQNQPLVIQAIVGILGGGVLLALGSVLFALIYLWQRLVGVVVCMEEDKRNNQALARAYDLLRGYWLPATSVMMLLGLGVLALMGILGSAGALLVGIPHLQRLFTGQQTPDATTWSAIILFITGGLGIWLLYTPVFYLTVVLIYLDLRVRKEALDLEWTAHVTAPAMEVGTPGAAPVEWTENFAAAATDLPEMPSPVAPITSFSAPETFAAEPLTSHVPASTRAPASSFQVPETQLSDAPASTFNTATGATASPFTPGVFENPDKSALHSEPVPPGNQAVELIEENSATPASTLNGPAPDVPSASAETTPPPENAAPPPNAPSGPRW